MIRHFVVTFAVLSGCTYETPDPGDPETPPTVAFEFIDSGADEEVGTVMIPVVLSKPSESVVTVSITAPLTGGSANDLDFEITETMVTFDPGTTRVMTPVVIKKDFDDTESDETVTLVLDSPVGATLDANKITHQILIADHILPRVNFATLSLVTTTMENTPTSLVIELTAPSEGESTLTLAVSPGATNPIDAEDLTLNADLVVTIPDGAMSVTIPLGELDDEFDEEDDEHVDFTLKGASQNLVLGTNVAASHTIQDNDATPTVSFALAANTVAENVGTANIEVSLSAISARPITVTYVRGVGTADAQEAVLNGVEITFTPHSINVAGEQTKIITVTVTDDSTDENNETVLVTLTNGTPTVNLGTTLTHTLTISADSLDPPPSVQFSEADDSRNESNNTEAVSFVLSAVSGKDVTVPFTVSGTAQDGGSGMGSNDYDLSLTSPVVIPAGQLTREIEIQLHEDGANEQNETVILTIGTPTNATRGVQTQYVCTILDDD